MSALTQESPQDLADLEAGLGILRIMDGTGDTRHTWDPNVPAEVELARKNFEEALKAGMRAYKVKRSGQPGDQITEFDPTAGKLIIAPALRGG
jgi:hypothetical protein